MLPSSAHGRHRSAIPARLSPRRARWLQAIAAGGKSWRKVITTGLWLWTSAGFAGPEFSQRSLQFDRWAREHGLPADAVSALLQTRDGYLWVGTSRGLARFDGVRFERLDLRGRAPAEAPEITALCEDEAGRLWIGTQKHGLFSAAASVQREVTPGPADIQTVNALAVDGEQQLWIGTPVGLFRMDLRAPLAPPRAVSGLPDSFVSSIHVARSGMIWITTRTGLYQFRRGRILPVEFSAESLGRSPEFIGIYEDRRGNLWAFGDTYLINLSEGKRFNYFRGGDAASLRIWSLCEGRGGELWIGTSGQGLFAFAEGRFRPLTLREGRLPGDVRAICEDREGNLWLGTFGSGLVRLRPRRELVLDATAGLPDQPAVCVAVSASGETWIGYERAGLWVAAGGRVERRSTQRWIRAVAPDPNGSAWVATAGDGLLHCTGERVIRHDTAHGLASGELTGVALETNGTVWAATGAGTLHRLVNHRWETTGPTLTAGETISALLAAPSGRLWLGTSRGHIFQRAGDDFALVTAASTLAGSGIRALAEDGLGRLWIATSQHGVACLADNQLQVVGPREGLPDADARAVVVESDRAVWVQSARGIYRLAWPAPDALAVTPASVRLVVEADRLPSAEPLFPGCPPAARGPDGRLWFLDARRVLAFDPVEWAAAPQQNLPVYIESVLANGVPVSSLENGRPLRLPSRLTSLEIRFTAINLSEPDRVRFQHRLEGFESDWVDSGPERRVRYGRLPYGHYTFRLRARHGDDPWSESQPHLALVCPAPWWRSYPALTLYAATAVAAVVVVVRTVSHRRLRAHLAHLAQQQAMERERMRIAQDMHDEIGSKLARISYLSELARHSQPAAGDSIEAIATTSRDLLRALDEIVWAVNPRNDTLEHLAVYLGHYATEYLQGTPLELELQIPTDLPAVPLSAEIRHNLFLAFQEALANALKHSGGNKLRVDMELADQRFVIRVSDNGRGLPPERLTPASGDAPARGNGLINLRQRLADVGGACEIESAPGKGTTVALHLPLPRLETALA